MKPFLSKHYWWLIAIVAALALMPRGVVSEAELNRQGPKGEDRAKWSEFLVYKLAAERMVQGHNLHRLDLKGMLSASESHAARQEHRELLGIEVSPKTSSNLNSHAYAYPPLWAMLTTPIAALGHYDLEAGIWHLLVMLGIVVALRIAYLLCFPKQSQAPPLEGGQQKGKKWLASPAGIGLSATVIAAGVLMSCVSNQQNDSMVFAFVMLGAWQLSKDRPWLAGIFFGAAAVSKGPLLLLLPWLVFKRRWRALASTILFGVALTLLPDLLFPRTSGKLYIAEWYQIALAPMLSSGEAAADSAAWFRFNELNQSLGATLDRLFGIGRHPDEYPALIEFSDQARKVLTLIVYAIIALVGLMIAKVKAWSPKRVFSSTPMPFVHAPHAPASRGLLLELSMIMIAACLLSPMTSPPHLCVLFVPLLLMLDALWRKPSRALVVISVICFAMLLFVHKDLLGRDVVNAMRFYGLSVWVMILMLDALLLISHRARSDSEPKKEAA